MSHIPAVRPLSALAVILTGGVLLSAPLMAAEEETQAQERIQQAESEEAGASQAAQERVPESEESEGDEPRDDETGVGADEPQDDETGVEADHAGHTEHVIEPEADEHADNPAVQAYREIAERMHEDMLTDFTGNPDADFALGMIPHHQGAIDMANVVLVHGEDEAIRDLAREIIEAQEEEIAFLRDWLARHGHEAE